MIPFLILYAGLIIECLAILVFILVGDTSLKSHVSQSYSLQKKYFIASSCLNIFTPSFQKLFLRKAMSPLVDRSFVLFLDFIESFTLSQPINSRCKFHWEEEGSLSRGAPSSLLPPLVFCKRDLQKHGETDHFSFLYNFCFSPDGWEVEAKPWVKRYLWASVSNQLFRQRFVQFHEFRSPRWWQQSVNISTED